MTNNDTEIIDSNGGEADSPITPPNYSQHSLMNNNNVNEISLDKNLSKAQPTTHQSKPDTQQQQQHQLSQRRLATALYLLTTSLLFADQNLLSPNLTAIATEFNFSDNQRDKKTRWGYRHSLFYGGRPRLFPSGMFGRRAKSSEFALFVGDLYRRGGLHGHLLGADLSTIVLVSSLDGM